MKRQFRIGRVLWIVLPGLLAACASTGPAPVEERSPGGSRTASSRPESKPAAQPPGGSYKVQRGDTLYSIAFRHGTDYRELAGWNGISAPYTIYVGQDLRLGPKMAAKPSAPPAATSSTKPTVAAAPAQTTKPSLPTPAPFEDVEASSASVPNPPPAPAAPATSTPATSTPAAPVAAPGAAAQVTTAAAPKPAEARPATPLSAPAAANVSGDVAWRWPADGQVVGSFVAGDQTKQGIDIAGKSGDPVRAAADGSVVYSGNGLIGYGELIIVKHSPGFLSAYGYNRKRLVKEGDTVKSGQVIAEMGSSSASRDSLHFEIRKNGKPSNPLDFLPRR